MEDFQKYKNLQDAVLKDTQTFFTLSHIEAGKAAIAYRSSPEAHEGIQRAYAALKNRQIDVAQDTLAEVERLNPSEPGLWAEFGYLRELQRNLPGAVECYRKEIKYQPQNTLVYHALAEAQRRLGQEDEEIATWQSLLKVAPQDEQGTETLARILISRKQPEQAYDAIEKCEKGGP